MVSFAFAKAHRDALLLAELVHVPRAPYRIVIRRNVVVLAREGEQAASRRALVCLR